MKRLRLRGRVMTSHDDYTSGTSLVLTLASLQRLKMEALIPASADGEVRSVIKFMNRQSLALIKIHHTGLVFGEFRVQIPVLTKLIGGSFRGFPQSSRQMLCWIYMATIYLNNTGIHKIHKSQILRQ